VYFYESLPLVKPILIFQQSPSFSFHPALRFSGLDGNGIESRTERVGIAAERSQPA
jgi:hypothetical protein